MTQKPDILFHGSPNGSIVEFEPRSCTGNANGPFPNGPRDLVFATDDYQGACIYGGHTDHLRAVGKVDGTYFGILTNAAEWREELAKASSAVYSLPSDSFTNVVLDSGERTAEWQSPEAVRPVGKTPISPELVMEQGSQLFALHEGIDQALWEQFSQRLGDKFARGLLPGENGLTTAGELCRAGLMRHLNAEQGIHPSEPPLSPNPEVMRAEVAWLRAMVASRYHAIPEAKMRCEDCCTAETHSPPSSRNAAAARNGSNLPQRRDDCGSAVPR